MGGDRERKRQRSKDKKRRSEDCSLERDRHSRCRDDETKRDARRNSLEGHRRRRDHRKRHDYRENDSSSRSRSSSSGRYRSRSHGRDRRREREEVRDKALPLGGQNMADDDSTRFFFTELVNKLTNNRPEGNRFPMIGNVIPEFDPMNKNHDQQLAKQNRGMR